jgi:hypothetical protein
MRGEWRATCSLRRQNHRARILGSRIRANLISSDARSRNRAIAFGDLATERQAVGLKTASVSWAFSLNKTEARELMTVAGELTCR